MKYPYIVKYNGVYYPAGAEVPDGKSDELSGGNAQKIIDVPAPEPTSDSNNDPNTDNDDPNVNVAPETNDDENTVGVPAQASGDNDDEEDEEDEDDDEPNAQFIPKPKYSKTAIQRMSTAEIRELAHEVGIENAVNKTGTQLKAELIEALNL